MILFERIPWFPLEDAVGKVANGNFVLGWCAERKRPVVGIYDGSGIYPAEPGFESCDITNWTYLPGKRPDGSQFQPFGASGGDTPAEDILRGVQDIAAFIGEDTRATYHKLSTGKLPGGKDGAQWVASKTVLREHYRRLTGGAQTPDSPWRQLFADCVRFKI